MIFKLVKPHAGAGHEPAWVLCAAVKAPCCRGISWEMYICNMDMQPEFIWIHMTFPENCGTPDRGKQRMTHEWWVTLIKKGQNWGDQSPCRKSRLEMLAGDEAVCPSRKRWALLASTGYILMRWLFVLFLSCTPTKKSKGTMWACDWKDLHQISAICPPLLKHGSLENSPFILMIFPLINLHFDPWLSSHVWFLLILSH